MALLEARGVARRYGSRVALAPTDLTLAAGDVVAVVGPNGAGKSTLLALLAGALPPSEGAVDRRGAVGWVPQRPAVYRHLTARENLDLFARLAGLPAAAAAALAQAFALPGGRVSGLSTGTQQRLNLALGLLGDPDVLLLDEPTASLDGERRAQLWELLRAHAARGGAAAFATHELSEVEHATRVLRIEDGVVVA